jgi:cyclopropane-fatty-acyl-phospholipid synthase
MILDAPAAAPPRATTPGLDAVARFFECLFPAPRHFDVRVGGETVLAATDEARFTLVIRSAGAVRRAFRPPVEASLGDAFIAGEIGAEGDLSAAFGLVDVCRRSVGSPGRVIALARAWRALPKEAPPARRDGAAYARLSGRQHDPERDRDAVRHHYDVGNDFYALFLGRQMVYSCAYYPTGTEDLDTAQELKLDHVCRKLRLKPGERLLDVGCGWGGLLMHAASRYGVHGVGVTLSEQQHALATQRVRAAGLDDRVQIRLADYRTVSGETFDKAASTGMLEHVGSKQLPEYFAVVHAALRPGGLFLNHGISRKVGTQPNRLKRLLADPMKWLLVGMSPLTSAVFPDSELVAVSELNLAAEQRGWEVRDVENLREHYSRTLRHWIERLEERQEEAEARVGAATVRAWLLYFAASAHRMDLALINVYQTLLAKPDAGGLVELPRSRADLYA